MQIKQVDATSAVLHDYTLRITRSDDKMHYQASLLPNIPRGLPRRRGSWMTTPRFTSAVPCVKCDASWWRVFRGASLWRSAQHARQTKTRRQRHRARGCLRSNEHTSWGGRSRPIFGFTPTPQRSAKGVNDFGGGIPAVETSVDRVAVSRLFSSGHPRGSRSSCPGRPLADVQMCGGCPCHPKAWRSSVVNTISDIGRTSGWRTLEGCRTSH